MEDVVDLNQINTDDMSRIKSQCREQMRQRARKDVEEGKRPWQDMCKK